MAHKWRRALALGTTTTTATWIDAATLSGGPGAGGLDLTTEAQVGDTIAVDAGFLWNSVGGEGRFDVATVVAGVLTNYFSSGSGVGNHLGMFYTQGGAFDAVGGRIFLAVQAGDISAAGTVTVRPLIRVATSGKGVSDQLFFALANIGPVDPF